MIYHDFLVEILTEELPPKSLLTLARAFEQQIKERLQKAGLAYDATQFFATPRRLAVAVYRLAAKQADQEIERRGPAFGAAFDDMQHPTPALLGFLRSANANVNDIYTIKTPQGEWVGVKQKTMGQSLSVLLPAIIEASLNALPIPKRMRWGDGEMSFVRPVHGVVMLYGEDILEGTVLGCAADRQTLGHRFHANHWLSIPDAKHYCQVLESEGYVLADFAKRQAKIVEHAKEWVQRKLGANAQVLLSDQALLDEVTGLVEWPVALCGQFDAEFLALPQEVLISAMQDHQRYFPIVNQAGQLLPYFVTIANLQTTSPYHVIHGNERVLKARLKDAAFFFAEDQKESLNDRVQRLKGMVYQARLGTLYDKAQRLSTLARYIAEQINEDGAQAARAGLLAKTDLTTHMVGEFPELQGVMGGYYAQVDQESADVQIAIREHYAPRFANDALPTNRTAQAVALADKIDTLVGAFGINQIPTGDKDPYGLRRAALGVLRILIQGQLNIDLAAVVAKASSCYECKIQLDESALANFFQERLRAWYQDQGISADIFAAVAAIAPSDPFDLHQRIQAVATFKTMPQAKALSMANKRVSNILTKYTDSLAGKRINAQYFEHDCEKQLAEMLASKESVVEELSAAKEYAAVLLQLAEIHQAVDNFFEHVMVMTDDKSRRENRILLLQQLRGLFLKVADIALLQVQER